VANIFPDTVTVNFDSADHKDTLLADFPSAISNCGSVRVEKVTIPEGETDTFPYTLKQTNNSQLRK
jgi:hypothetical protein